VRPGAYPCGLNEVALFRQSLALLENIRLGRKGLPGENTLAYFAPPTTTKEKV